MAKARGWTFTVNNYTSEDEAAVHVLSQEAKYIVVGKEVGENGTPHYQGYVFFANPRVFNVIKKLLPRAHIEVAKGNPEQNRTYCTKGGDILIEQGEVPKAGRRTDIEQIRDFVKEKPKMREVVNEATSLQAIKVAEVWLKYHEKPRTWKPEVKWYYGSTGSGKTKSAREWLGEDIYTCMSTSKWFEGYDGHENVLIDDFRKNWATFNDMLRILDRYEYRVETKGGSRQFVAKKIAITAPYRPEHMYQLREDVNQLLRRIDEVILVGEDPSKQFLFKEDDDL